MIYFLLIKQYHDFFLVFKQGCGHARTLVGLRPLFLCCRFGATPQTPVIIGWRSMAGRCPPTLPSRRMAMSACPIIEEDANHPDAYE